MDRGLEKSTFYQLSPSNKAGGFVGIGELTIGTICHTLHIPLSGFWLSLHQIFWMSWASGMEKRVTSFQISSITALMKVFAPMGKRLSPVFAILMQGFLYALGPLIFGHNAFGWIIGSILASLWSFIQPILIGSIIFGSSLFQGFSFLETWLQNQSFSISLYTVIACFVVLKLILAISLCLLALKISKSRLKQWEKFIVSTLKIAPKRRPSKSFWRGLIKDLLSPWFLLSLTLSIIALTIQSQELVTITISLMRIMIIALIVFSLLRLINPQDIVNRLSRLPSLKEPLTHIFSFLQERGLK